MTPLGSTGSREASQDEVRCCHARRKEAAPLSTIFTNRGPTQFHAVPFLSPLRTLRGEVVGQVIGRDFNAASLSATLVATILFHQPCCTMPAWLW